MSEKSRIWDEVEGDSEDSREEATISDQEENAERLRKLLEVVKAHDPLAFEKLMYEYGRPAPDFLRFMDMGKDPLTQQPFSRYALDTNKVTTENQNAFEVRLFDMLKSLGRKIELCAADTIEQFVAGRFEATSGIDLDDPSYDPRTHPGEFARRMGRYWDTLMKIGEGSLTIMGGELAGDASMATGIVFGPFSGGTATLVAVPAGVAIKGIAYAKGLEAFRQAAAARERVSRLKSVHMSSGEVPPPSGNGGQSPQQPNGNNGGDPEEPNDPQKNRRPNERKPEKPSKEPTEAEKRLPDSNLKIQRDKQAKHQEGHRNYKPDIGKSRFTHSDSQRLIDQYAGTGVETARSSGIKGQHGYQEIVDFGETVGYYFDRDTGVEYLTNRGTIHYAKDGVHIVPAPPH